MKSGSKLISWAIAGAICAWAGTARASLTVTLVSDTGSLTVQLPPAAPLTPATIANPYGAPPVPTLVPITNGFALTFDPTSDFFANSTSAAGSKTTTMDGKLNLTLVFSSPVKLTTNIYEDGIFSQLGSGTANVTGSVSVSDVANTETHNSSFPIAAFNPVGTWSIFDQLTGFTGTYTTYNVSIDNTLIASALATASGSAYIAKKDFTIIFTTDGSSGNGPPSPEPASLGVLALGGVALLTRRRK
jgi:hypothetical protein